MYGSLTNWATKYKLAKTSVHNFHVRKIGSGRLIGSAGCGRGSGSGKVRPEPDTQHWLLHLQRYFFFFFKHCDLCQAANRRRKELSYLSSYVSACSRAATLAVKQKMDDILDTR
jgi:hypothetical protein